MNKINKLTFDDKFIFRLLIDSYWRSEVYSKKRQANNFKNLLLLILKAYKPLQISHLTYFMLKMSKFQEIKALKLKINISLLAK